MVVTPTQEQLVALVSMIQQSRWARVDDMIEAEILQATDRMLKSCETADLHYARGYITALKNFQSTARDAPKMLEKLGIKTPL